MILSRHFYNMGGLSLLGLRTLLCFRARPIEFKEIIRQMESIGVASLSITNITALFTGMVLALQTAYALAYFGAKLFIGEVVGLSLVRELGPVLTALMVGGRVGAGITAELGSMAVTQQVDAIRVMAADPIKKLVFPRVLSMIMVLPMLTILSMLLGILGGLVIAVWELNVSASFYLTHVWRTISYEDLFTGIGKSFFFAASISLIACFNGLYTRGGATGVGRATTETVVMASISVLIMDFFITKLFILIL